jgi:hypothetical protein
VARHQGMNGTKQCRRYHGDPDHSVLATRNTPEALSDATVEPVLDVDQSLHALV